MRAVKSNKEYMIDDAQQKFYQDSGYDIVDDDGEIVAYGRGKTVPYNDYMKAVKEIGRLQELCTELNTENDSLRNASGEKADAAPVAPEEKREKTAAKKAGE